jgi:hypothetical protein
VHRGSIHIGIPFLKATADQLSTLRQKSMTHRDVVDFPVQGQATHDYETLFLSAARALRMMGANTTSELNGHHRATKRNKVGCSGDIWAG